MSSWCRSCTAEASRCPPAHSLPQIRGEPPALTTRPVGQLAVCTHSDRAEYNAWIKPETHVLGEDLVAEVLRASVPEHAAHFFVFAYNPQVRYNILLPFFPHMIGPHPVTPVETPESGTQTHASARAPPCG